MLEISDLGLTVTQVNELLAEDPTLVSAWLAAASDPDVRSPTGFFLAGVRSGLLPGDERSPDRARAVLQAERWIARVGLLYDREADVLGELFDKGGLLRHFAGDEALRERLLSLWRWHRPRGEQAERDFVERNRKLGQGYRALREEMKK